MALRKTFDSTSKRSIQSYWPEIQKLSCSFKHVLLLRNFLPISKQLWQGGDFICTRVVFFIGPSMFVQKCYVYKSYIVDAASYVNCFSFFIIKSLFPLTVLCNYAMYDTCSPKLLWKREPVKLLQASYRNMMQQPIFFHFLKVGRK